MKLLLSVIFYLMFFCVLAQEIPMKYYTVKDGLANSLVPSIFQDKKGNVWFPTLGGGVSKFNGQQFIIYGAEQGLSNQMIRTVTEDKNGRIWFGSMGEGVFYLDKDTILAFKNDSLPDEIFALHTDNQGIVWAATNGGVFHLFSKDSIVPFGINHNLPVSAVTHINSDKQGNIWFGYDSEYGLYEYSNGKLTVFNKENGLTNGRILYSFHDSRGDTWVTMDDGLYVIEKGAKIANKIVDPNLPSYYLFECAEPVEGTLLIGSQQNGMYVFDTKTRKVKSIITQKNGLKSALVFRILADYENNIWISNWGDGVARINFSGLTKYAEKSGIKSRIIYSIQKTDEGILSATSDGVIKLNGKSVEPFIYDKIKGNILHVYKSDKLTFCAREQELILVNGASIKSYTNDNLKAVKAITKSLDGKIYLASWGGGISYYDNGNFIPITDTAIAAIKYYYCSFCDSKGRMWFGSWDAGVVCYDGVKWRQYSKKDGLRADKISCITEDKAGRIIIGTNGGGIAFFDGKHFEVINSSKGLPSNSVYAVAVDKHNNLWAGFQGSIVKINLNTRQIKTISQESGFDGDVMFNSMLVDEDTVWIGTNNFLWKYVETDAYEIKKNLRVFLTAMEVNYKPRDISLGLRLLYDENKITFHYLSTQIFNNSSLKYSYRLLGSDSLFSPLTNQTEITFQELAPGSYTFQVKACLGNDYSIKPASYEFVIKPPFWKTWWFYLLVAGSIIALIRIYIVHRERKLTQRQKELEETVLARTMEISNQKKIVEHQKELVQEKQKEIIDSITYAKRLQQAILPPDNLIQQYFPNSFIYYQPKDLVAGDFYWVHVQDECIYIAAADSTGHGVPGALVSIVCSNALDKAVNEFGLTDTGKILDKTTDLVLDTFSKGGEEIKDGMDISLLCFNLKKQEINWSGANNQLWYIKNNELIEVKADKQPVGKSDHRKDFTSHNIKWERGMSLYLFTDGYSDQFGGPKGKKFKYKQIGELLLSINDKTMKEQCAVFNQTFINWKGHLEQVDDVTVIGIKL